MKPKPRKPGRPAATVRLVPVSHRLAPEIVAMYEALAETDFDGNKTAALEDCIRTRNVGQLTELELVQLLAARIKARSAVASGS